MFDQFCDAGAAWKNFSIGDPKFGIANTPEAAVVGAGAPRNFAARRATHPLRVLNELAVEIDDVERAIRAGREVHGMKPGISRSQKLLLALAAPRDERNAIRLQHTAMHEVQQRFAHESVTAIFLTERAAAENREAGQRVEILH
jgi:hypothetical protein